MVSPCLAMLPCSSSRVSTATFRNVSRSTLMLSFLRRHICIRTIPGKFGPNPRWSNSDMDPVPPALRTWTTWNYIAYWVSDAANTAGWELASSMLAVGLSRGQALSAIAVGHSILAVVVLLNGTTGARLHVSFPVLNRSSFGFWLSYFSVISRMVLAIFWFGIETHTGGKAIYQMLKAIWPSIGGMANYLPEDAYITTSGLMCYFLYWFLQFPFMLISPQKIKHVFTIKAVFVPTAWLAILIWAVVKDPPHRSFAKPSTVSGSEARWLWMVAVNSSVGLYATISVNIPDFTRYARTERSQYVQVIVIPALFTLVGFVGIAVTSAGERLYNETLWDPLDLIDHWDNRAAAFFASFSFALATLATNISANSLSAANDMMVLFPKYINIRRGQAICAIIGGWAVCPWQISGSAPGLLVFMSGYTIFLGPFVGIMIVDYWLVHRFNVNVVAMYDPHGIYRYWNGINWRAAVALIVSVAPNFPGLINNINRNIDVGNATYLFAIAWIFGFFTASGVYWILSALFPATEMYMDSLVLGEELLDTPDTDEKKSPSENSENLIPDVKEQTP